MSSIVSLPPTEGRSLGARSAVARRSLSASRMSPRPAAAPAAPVTLAIGTAMVRPRIAKAVTGSKTPAGGTAEARHLGANEGASCGGRRELPTLARRRSGRAFRPAGARGDDVDAVLDGDPDEACAGDRGRLLGPSGAGRWREIAPARGDGGRSRLCGRPGRRTPRWARRWCCPAPRPRRVRAAAQGDRR